MISMTQRHRFCRGVSLLETMVSIVVLAIVVIGVSGYRYHSASDARRADVQITAARVASLLLNGWKGAGGYSGYAVPAWFNAIGSKKNQNYKIVVDGVNYYATLSYKDKVGRPRLLNVRVAWMNGYRTRRNSKSYQSVALSTYAND